MDRYQNKYRIPSARLLNWDYGADGAYFITICTRNREHYFGEIENGQMQLNEMGLLAKKYWLEIPKHFPSVELGNFIIMPNHIHGILILHATNTLETLQSGNENNLETLQCNVSTLSSTNIGANAQMAKITPRAGSVSTIIRSYKSVVAKNAHYIHADFNWQTRFHDHIIRDARAFETIQNYIANNPSNWEKDKFYDGIVKR